MTSTKHTLPLIDISPFIGSSATNEAANHCATALYDACVQHGFFYLTNHQIPTSLTDRVLHHARIFFTECSNAEKQAIKRQEPGNRLGDGARGYQIIGDNVTQGKRDWHEALDWYRPIIAGEGIASSELERFFDQRGNGKHEEGRKTNGAGNRYDARQSPYSLLRGINLWPDKPSEFRAIYEIYVEKLLGLGTAVVRAMGRALELEDPEIFVKATRDSFWVMRAIGYPPLPKRADINGTAEENVNADADADVVGDESISCGAHTDYGCLTLLLADSTPGALQVLSHTSGHWINADPIPGALVVNIGDMMERWTNGLWKSTVHKVVHRGEGFRVSVPFFFEPDFEAMVMPLKGCVEKTRGKPVRGEVNYGEYLLGKVGGNFDEASVEGS